MNEKQRANRHFPTNRTSEKTLPLCSDSSSNNTRPGRRDVADLIARTVVRRPGWVIATATLLTLACVWLVRSKPRFDSEVLNLLPAHSEAVEAMKELNNDFAQGRELTFALQGTPETTGAFQEYLVENLRHEPWTRRVFAGSPMEDPAEIATLQRLVPSLLLNLNDEAFGEALTLLRPEIIKERLNRLRTEMEAGSPRAEFELSSDAFGFLGRALQPLASMHGMQRGEVLASADGSLRVIPVVTSGEALSVPECRQLMSKVDAFIARVRADWTGTAPEVLVTGRAAYVAQISSSMERDIQVTSTVSILAVSGLFYLGFRRLLPLAGITLILGLSCFLAFAVGCLVFNNLNLIAISFCSILVGLGDDFSMLLYNRYLQARADREGHEDAVATSVREMGRGIFYVALTTGIGFLALLFSGSKGFAQLGTLIAVGIVLCGLMMITLLFVFIRPHHAPPTSDPVSDAAKIYANATHRRPVPLGVGMCLVFFLLAVFLLLPIRPLRFDTSPRSLEPKHAAASKALKTIMEKIPAVAEPVAAIVEAKNAQEAHDRWEKLTKHFQQLVTDGQLKGFSSPAALMLSPEQIRKNQEALRRVNLAMTRSAFEATLRELGFNVDSFANAFELLDSVTAAAAAKPEQLLDFSALIPPQSSWWFLIDRYFSSKPNVAAAFLQPAQALTTAEEQATFENRIKAAGVPVKVTGWSYAMVGLVPWAKRELLLFSSGVGLMILLVLAFAYREWRSWLIHTASLAFAICATVAALKLAGVRINLLNALAFPLILGVGVDYGMHVLFALRETGARSNALSVVLKPLVISGLTTITGFGSLMLARNPALSGLGTVCALGVACCLVSSVLFIVPLFHMASAVRHAAGVRKL